MDLTHGIRVDVPADTVVEVRDAVVVGLDGLVLDEPTVLGRYTFPDGPYLSAELAALWATSPRQSFVAPGNVVLRVGFVDREPHTTFTCGLRGTWFDDGWTDAEMWGSVGEAVLPQKGVAVDTTWSMGRLVLSGRLGGRVTDRAWPIPVLDAELGVAFVQPVLPWFSVGGELEALVDPSPLVLRAFGRFRPLGRWTLDLGLSADAYALSTHVPSLDGFAGTRLTF